MTPELMPCRHCGRYHPPVCSVQCRQFDACNQINTVRSARTGGRLPPLRSCRKCAEAERIYAFPTRCCRCVFRWGRCPHRPDAYAKCRYTAVCRGGHARPYGTNRFPEGSRGGVRIPRGTEQCRANETGNPSPMGVNFIGIAPERTGGCAVTPIRFPSGDALTGFRLPRRAGCRTASGRSCMCRTRR